MKEEKPLTLKIFNKENPKYDWIIEDVMIGSGVYGRVYKAFDSKSQKEYALKIIEVKEYESEVFADLVNEIFILRKLAEKNQQGFYVQLYDNYIIVD